MYCCTQAAFHLMSTESEPNCNIGRGVSVTKDTCFKEINEQMNVTCMYNITYQEQNRRGKQSIKMDEKKDSSLKHTVFVTDLPKVRFKRCCFIDTYNFFTFCTSGSCKYSSHSLNDLETICKTTTHPLQTDLEHLCLRALI